MLLLMLCFVWLICWIQVHEFWNGNGKCQIIYNRCTFLLDVYYCSFIFVKPVSILFTSFTISLVALIFVPWNVLAWLDCDYEVGLSFFNVALICWHTLYYLQDCRSKRLWFFSVLCLLSSYSSSVSLGHALAITFMSEVSISALCKLWCAC